MRCTCGVSAAESQRTYTSTYSWLNPAKSAKPELSASLRQTKVESPASDRHRRDRHCQGTSLLDHRVGLESGAIIFVGNGKGGDALKPFWKRLRRCHARIEAAAIDMSPAYIDAISTHLPNAKIVFDHFHVIKLFNDKLSRLRRDLYHEATDTLQRKVLKGTRWLLQKIQKTSTTNSMSGND